MRIEFDSAKDDANRAKHGISLQAAGGTMTKFDPTTQYDNPPLEAAFMAGMTPTRRGRPRLAAPKVEVKIRLDASTVEHLRNSGPGWQTRVNAVLGQLMADGRI